MNVKNLVLGLGIFIVFMFLLHNGIRAFYPSPEYDSFCKAGSFYEPIAKPITGGQECAFLRGLQEQEQVCYLQEGRPIYNYDEKGCAVSVKECNLCEKEYNSARDEYNKKIFIIALVIGIIILLIGYTKLSVEPVGSSLMASGIGGIVYGTIVNWENLGSLGRFLLLLLAFLVLVWIALKLNIGNKKSFWQKIGLRK